MRTFAFLCALSFVACSTGGGGDTDGGSDSGSGAVTLVVNSTATPSAVAGFPPPNGTYLQELNITLGNVGVSKAISASFQNYTLQTDQSLVLQFSTASDIVDTPCSMGISVANGGVFTCNLVFNVPIGQKPVTLYYDDTVGDTASAEVPPPPPPDAGPPKTDCEIVNSATNGAGDCNTCVYNAQQGSCGVWEKNANCSSTSDQLCSPNCPNPAQSGAKAYCDCVDTCLSSKCVPVIEAWFTCIKNACTVDCGFQ